MEKMKHIFGQSMPKKTTFQYATIVTALVLVGQFPGLQSTLQTTASTAMSNVASVVGMGASVPPNEQNLVAQALEEKKLELDQRERDIDAREREIRAVVAEETAKQNRITLFVISAVTLLLVLLIVLNFYLDRARGGGAIPSVRTPGTAHDPHAHEGEFTTKL